MLTLLLVAGCATAPQTRQLLETPIAGLPTKTELSLVPFYPQERYQCGPAALATALNWSGLSVLPEDLVSEIYLPERQGSLQLEILASSRRHNRIAYPIEPNMGTLLREVASGNPVLVLQNLGLSWAPTWHYAVVVGFDLSQQTMVLRSGLTARQETNMHTFELTWQRGGFWGITVLPPEQLPATAKPDRYLKTVIALEKTRNWHTALTAYRTALERWPDNLLAYLGLGNSAYHLGDLESAAQAFRNGIQHHPQAAPLHNNLAQVLMEQGALLEAQQHAQRAVDLGGPQQVSFKATLAEINERLAKKDALH